MCDYELEAIKKLTHEQLLADYRQLLFKSRLLVQHIHDEVVSYADEYDVAGILIDRARAMDSDHPTTLPIVDFPGPIDCE